MNILRGLLDTNGFLPHGYCFTWSPGLLWSMVGADAIIALAYFSIPAAIWTFVRKRDDARIHGPALMFAAFIFACGTTHLMDVWTVWYPDYGLQVLTKSLTALISIATAVWLWLRLPKALELPTAAALERTVAQLQAEVDRRIVAERVVDEIQQNLAITLQSNGAGFIATDREGRVTRLNGVAEDLLGWSEAEALGRSLWQVFQREDRPTFFAERNPIDLMLEQGVKVETVHRLVAVTRSGRRTPVDVQAALTQGRDARVSGMAMIIRDATALERAEQQANRLAAIVECSSDAIVGKTLDGRITSWNPAAEKMFGYSAEEAVGMPVQTLIPDDRIQEEMRIVTQLAQGRTVEAFDTVRRSKSGRLIDVSISVSPIRDGEGRVIGAAKIARDVSLLRRTERAEAENQRVREASRVKSLFMANMSHELRTPLNAIIGFADLLRAGYAKPGSPQFEEFLGHIQSSGDLLLHMVNDVLDLAKVEAGKLQFQPQKLRLPDLLNEAAAMMAPTAARKGIAIHLDLDPSVIEAVLDPARLKQVLYNYLSNACKFAPSGGSVKVRLSAEGEDAFRIEIQDGGSGIAPADIARLFTEFEQLDAGTTKSHQGTGLGLALTKRLVEAQGGRVGVRSVLGAGSVFFAVLPRDATVVRPEIIHALQRALVVGSEGGSDRTELAKLLLAAGFEVDVAEDRDTALQRARSIPYAALTLALSKDLGSGGLDLLDGIRSQGASSASPVINVSVPTALRTANFAVTNVLSKPIRSDELISAVALLRRGLPPTAMPKVVLIDDDPAATSLMRATLGSLGVATECFADGPSALAQVTALQPDAIVLDLMMPKMDGFEVLYELNRLPEVRHTPVFIWTSMQLTDADYARLKRSAEAILESGGGSLAELDETIRRRGIGAIGIFAIEAGP